jgi:hypothetical protein
MLSRAELVLILVGVAVTGLLGWLAPAPFRSARRGFGWLASRRGLAVLLVGLLAAGASAAVSVGVAWPEPRIHDEFSYLLAADTFAHGRLANPTPPQWEFFETFHVNQRPVYASIYPPGQGLFLALGQVLTGYPLAGVWISFGCAGAALCWMLQGWLPPRWALGGALLAVVRLGFLGSWAGQQGYWSQSYWGGAVALLGGALVCGALRRLLDRPRTATAIVLAVGLAVLANSRPFEGMVLGVAVAAVLLAWGLRHRRLLARRVLLPGLVVLGLAGGATGYYNFRLTGNALLMPYQLNGSTYAFVPLFLWQPLQPEPSYRHPMMADYHVRWAKDKYLELRTIPGYVEDVAKRFQALFSFFFGLALLLPLIALPWIVRDRWMRWAVIACGLLMAAHLLTTWFQPHYVAPVVGLWFVLVVQGLRHVRLWRGAGRPLGRLFVQAMPVVYLGLFVVSLGIVAQVDEDAWYMQRARLLSRLERDGAQHLVVVRYAPTHSSIDEWVFNAANLDQAPVVWARDRGDAVNQSLLSAFPNHRPWLLEADAEPPRLTPYFPGQARDTGSLTAAAFWLFQVSVFTSACRG